jgi:hypothetical protein
MCQKCKRRGVKLSNDDANCVSIGVKYGIEAIVSAMAAHRNVSKVQRRGGLALGILASNHENYVSIAEMFSSWEFR